MNKQVLDFRRNQLDILCTRFVLNTETIDLIRNRTVDFVNTYNDEDDLKIIDNIDRYLSTLGSIILGLGYGMQEHIDMCVSLRNSNLDWKQMAFNNYMKHKKNL